MVHCARLLCDVGISCAHILIYPEWADPSSIVVAFHYNLHISRNTLIPVCLPFAFAFQLAQSQSALQSCRAIVFEKEGSCVMQNSKRKCQASYQASVWWVVLLPRRCMWNVLKLSMHSADRGRAYIWVCSCVVWWQATRRARSFFWFFCALWCVEVLVSSASCWRTCTEWSINWLPAHIHEAYASSCVHA